MESGSEPRIFVSIYLLVGFLKKIKKKNEHIEDFTWIML